MDLTGKERWGKEEITASLWFMLSGCGCAFISRLQIQPGAGEKGSTEDQSCSHTHRPRQRARSPGGDAGLTIFFSSFNTTAQLRLAARLKGNVLM